MLRFASLGTTEQGDSATRFRVDYLKPSGAIGLYYPDWVVVQQTESGELSWIISALADAPWRFTRVNQVVFEARRPVLLADLTEELLLPEPPHPNPLPRARGRGDRCDWPARQILDGALR